MSLALVALMKMGSGAEEGRAEGNRRLMLMESLLRNSVGGVPLANPRILCTGGCWASRMHYLVEVVALTILFLRVETLG